MSSQTDPPQVPSDETNVEALSFQELLLDAKQGSIPHLLNMTDQVKEKYPEHAQAVLDVITANLEKPEDIQTSEVPDDQLSAVLISLHLLIEVAQSYLVGSNSPIGPGAIVSHALAEKYLFWIHYFFGIHTSPPPAEPTINTSIRSHLVFYPKITSFLHLLFIVPSITYESFPADLKPMLLQAAIALWVVLVDGQTPIYPRGRSEEAHINSDDLFLEFFSKLTEIDRKGVADAIMSGRTCTRKLFAQRTIGWMRALGNLRALTHLSHLPAITIELTNMSNVLAVAAEPMFVDHQLEPAFVEEGAVGVFVEIYTSLADRMERAVREEADGWGTPERKQKAGDYIWGCIQSVVYLLSMITAMSSISVLKQMEETTSCGALRLLSISEILPPQQNIRGDSPWTILDFAFMFACHLEDFPAIYKDVTKYMAPRVPDLLTVARGNPGYPLDPQLPAAFDINMMKSMLAFVDKEKRVPLCDNLKHYDRLRTSNSMTLTSQEEHACSRCHSVAYCSVQCQHEDWAALHKAECKHMAKDYAEWKKKTETSTHIITARSKRLSYDTPTIPWSQVLNFSPSGPPTAMVEMQSP